MGAFNSAGFGSPAAASTAIEWTDITEADFVSLNAYTDPNSTATGAISVAAGGIVTMPLQSDTTAWDGPAEGAGWRTKLATAAYGWLGDGTQEIVLKFTPTSNPGVTTKPMVMGGFCDKGGDPGGVNARITAGGYAFTSATEAGYSRASAALVGYIGGAVTYAGNTPSVTSYHEPIGPVGDDTNGAGPINALCGNATLILRTDDSTYAELSDIGPALPTHTISDAVYFDIFGCFDGADGARNATPMIFRLQYLIRQKIPTKEWS